MSEKWLSVSLAFVSLILSSLALWLVAIEKVEMPAEGYLAISSILTVWLWLLLPTRSMMTIAVTGYMICLSLNMLYTMNHVYFCIGLGVLVVNLLSRLSMSHVRSH
ncbi:hypothetical protein [Vibrio mediterranei]|uniref:hypothetical protein n=1 Tax=Vibrio mediterranei TaxID=689 RepID=UPI0040698352